MLRATQQNMLKMLKKKESWIKTKLAMFPMTEVIEINKREEKLADVENNILWTEYKINSNVELPLTEKEKGEWQWNQKAYRVRFTKHMLNSRRHRQLSSVSVPNVS
jgi:hypothetical protein